MNTDGVACMHMYYVLCSQKGECIMLGNAVIHIQWTDSYSVDRLHNLLLGHNASQFGKVTPIAM